MSTALVTVAVVSAVIVVVAVIAWVRSPRSKWCAWCGQPIPDEADAVQWAADHRASCLRANVAEGPL